MIDLIIAVIIDFIIGDPEWLPHPIKLMGKIISFEEKIARKFFKRQIGLLFSGFLIVIVNIILAFVIPAIVLRFAYKYKYLYHVINIYLLYTCIAARCLHNEGMKIYRAIQNSIEDARLKLSYIVGRDTKNLKKPEIVRATVETIAENTSDGVIAPLLYAMIGGAPLAMCYKMVNTMDSMLGYMNEKYKDIGCFPARIDDVFNFIPARMTGILMSISGAFKFHVLQGFTMMTRDGRKHKSPNCGYPESAVAGLLGVQLGGDNMYFGEIVKKPKIGDKKRELVIDDIKNAIEIMYRTEILLIIIYVLVVGVSI